MATNYASAVRNGTMAAARLHAQLGTRARLEATGGSVDVFGTSLAVDVPLILRPLKKLLGAYLPEPIPGILVTTERPLSIQRFTAAHELGHYRLKHLPSLDDESILRRMALPDKGGAGGSNLQEIEADAFAVAFVMPRWLIDWHLHRQGWQANELVLPHNVYQLSLRLGASYEATTWTLQRHNLISASIGRMLRETQPRKIKVELLRDYAPSDYRGDVWLLTDRDCGTQIDGSRNDHFVLRLSEHSGGGYLWDIDELKRSGFAIIRDNTESMDDAGVGSPVIRRITAAVEHPQRGEFQIREARPWQSNASIAELRLYYDLTGPEEQGFSRAERRQTLKAA